MPRADWAWLGVAAAREIGFPVMLRAGYAVVDAKLSYPLTPKLTATFDVNNVFDREYYSRVGSTTTFNFYGPSRTFLVGARYEF